MTRSSRLQNQILGISSRAAMTALAIVFVLMVVVTQAAQAQTYSVVHTFTGKGDGGIPEAGLTMDGSGNFYGTTYGGGSYGYGIVFKMTAKGSGWTITPLYSFRGGADGGQPASRVVFGPDGSFYGTTQYDTVFDLKPTPTRPASVFSPWTLTTLYQLGGSDGFSPAGDLVFDHAGNLYGAAFAGGNGCYEGCGTIYELTPSGGSWTESTAYAFNGTGDGAQPVGVMIDNAGNLYGAAENGGTYGAGTVFELTPSESGWVENTLYSFDNSGIGGILPQGGLTSDSAGNLYGSTSDGPGSSGVIFELSPSNGSWTYTVLYNLPSKYEGGPAAPLTMDAAGNLYGTINGYCVECPGAIFKLTRGGNGWTFASLHDFTGGSDGGHPYSNVVIDAKGNLYGTASAGGTGCFGEGCGVVWKIAP
jgi:uncharacterized repeat protein (TIGR03803 family)